MALLSSKLHPPKPRRGSVARQRLLALLDGAWHVKLTVVSAAAGYGKTTLLRDWQQKQPQACAWLQLDEADNDLTRFLRYFVRAWQGLLPQPLQLSALTPQNYHEGLAALLNALAELGRPCALLLDDYHSIHNPEVHEALRYWLDYAPEACHLLLGSRRQPDLPLARYRAQGQLLELNTATLRFTAEESRLLLQGMDVALPPPASRMLNARTEGWGAGLQLAALSLQGKRQAQADVLDFIERFTGTDRYVLDYLTEEVLTRQRIDVQNFLQLTSVLEQLCAPLCDAVSQRQDSHLLLEELERANLFITALDNQRQWYRYHSFFADLLRQRLQRSHPELLPQLHLRASAWFRSAQQASHALRHAWLAADAPYSALCLLEHPRASALLDSLNLKQASGLANPDIAHDAEHDIEHVAGQLQPLLQAPDAAATLATLLQAAEHSPASSDLPSDLNIAMNAAVSAEVTSADIASTDIEALSERELEVLQLVAAGLSNKAIAKRLGISLNTVKTHSKNIHSKLGVRNRTEASAKARRLELLPRAKPPH